MKSPAVLDNCRVSKIPGTDRRLLKAAKKIDSRPTRGGGGGGDDAIEICMSRACDYRSVRQPLKQMQPGKRAVNSVIASAGRRARIKIERA